MMGYNHVACGLCAGIATLPVTPVDGAAAQTAWVLALGGAALLPDLDTRRSTAARMWGPLTGALGVVVGTVARGHRRGTHDALLAPLAFGGIALLASLNPWTMGVVLALTVGLAIRGLALSGVGKVSVTANLLISVAVAWLLVRQGAWQLSLLPLVLVAGVLVHIAGDWLTTEGVPIPVAWIRNRRRRVGLALFSVNGAVEHRVVAPVLTTLGIVLLARHLGIHDWDSFAAWLRSLDPHAVIGE